MDNDDLKLSICVVTYNHEAYIAQALDSFLMQKTNFKFQVIVGDDASTDRTQEILRNYAERYPHIIKPILREKNIQPINNSLDVYSRAKTKYVAICDGDDYWTDENKLQMQVDFLEANPHCAICYHPTLVKFEDGDHKDIIYPAPEHRFNKKVMTIEDLAVRNPMHTNSLVYRWGFCKGDIKDFMPNNICPGDYFLALLHAETGDIGFIDKVMSVYRVNRQGMSFEIHKRPDLVWLKYGFEELNFYRAVDKHFQFKLSKYFRKAVEKKSSDILDAFITNSAFDKLQKFKDEYQEYYQIALDDYCLKKKRRSLSEDSFFKVIDAVTDIWRRRKKMILAVVGIGMLLIISIFFLVLFVCLRLLMT